MQMQTCLQMGFEASMPLATQEVEKSSRMLGLPGTIMASARAQELQQPLIQLQVRSHFMCTATAAASPCLHGSRLDCTLESTGDRRHLLM